MSPQVLEDILHAVADLRMPKTDGVIIEALKIPREIFQHDGEECRKYKRSVERQIRTHPAIKPVSVRWTVHGDCYLEKAV
jgi:hypothetical protein